MLAHIDVDSFAHEMYNRIALKVIPLGGLNMRYRDLNISFRIENAVFTIPSLSYERHLRPIPMHAHSKNSYELHYISSGSGTVNCGGIKYHAAAGSVFMTGPGVPHEQLSDLADPMEEYCVYFKIDRDGGRKKAVLTETFAKTVLWFGSDDGRVWDIISRIFSELEALNPRRELMIESLIIQLVLTMVRLYSSGDGEAKETAQKSTAGDLTYLIIEETFLYDYNTATLSSLAEKLGLGTRQTERLLKKHYNMSFSKKKTEARMFAASTLLRESHRSVSEISELVGYSSCEHFCAAFKKYSGLTPGEYRNKGKL